MTGQKIKVGFICSTEQFLDICGEAARLFNIDPIYAKNSLDDALYEASLMIREGVDIIISRRGTAHILRENLKVPVLAARFSAEDLCRNIRDASKLGKKILLTVFGDETIETDIFEEIFNVKILLGRFHDKSSLEQAIIWGKSQECEVVIGGGHTQLYAGRHGLHSIILQTTLEAVRSTLEDAISIVESLREDQKKHLLYRAIMDTTFEGIIAVNREGTITNMNKAAQELLNLQETPVNGKSLTSILHDSSINTVLRQGQTSWNKVERINGESFLTNYRPLVVGNEVTGAVMTFKDIKNVFQAEQAVRRTFSKHLRAKYTFSNMIYKSRSMEELILRAKKYAISDSTMLISGETGTGKEILAQSIHNYSNRANGSFVSINCAAVPDQLLESELFGHEEGAFTGARRGGRPGLFELAHNGTMFLDEIALTPLSLQARLLRVLQEREVMRIGGNQLIPVNVRVIAATNRDLGEEVREGRFREDLFFRLNVLTLSIPSLKERSVDIPVIVEALIRESSQNHNKLPVTIPRQYLKKLTLIEWPGNVRQLQNVIDKLVILSDGDFNDSIFNELYEEVYAYSCKREQKKSEDKIPSLSDSRNISDRLMYKNIYEALETERFNKKAASKKLGISRTTLWRRLKSMEERL
ncbi:MAG: sigma 54-interacting transcriptional regulator [Deltaproteobacteria bacterium]|nr:sigma 54-interacting transcriptional regulator [Deltaproteobacteria bacterium]